MTGIAVSIILCALVAVAAIALTVLLGAWVYRDAKSKGMNGVLWTAVAILVPSYIGLIIYLIVRMDNNKVTCSNCDTAVSGKERFCSNCGVELVPATDASADEAFRSSQKKILIAFFSTLAAIVIMTIFMIASLVTGTLKMVGDAIEWAAGFENNIQWAEELEDALGDIDVLFDEDEIHLSVDGEKVEVTDKAGNSLIKIDGENETVDVQLKDLRSILERYNISYDENMDEEELEALIKQEIEEAIEDSMEEKLENGNTEEK